MAESVGGKRKKADSVLNSQPFGFIFNNCKQSVSTCVAASNVSQLF